MKYTLLEPDSEELPLTLGYCRESYGTHLAIPFHSWVASSPPETGTHPPSFPHLFDLPHEILLLILRFCSPQTLFQLARTSSRVRHDALELFWGHSAVWYYISADWWRCKTINTLELHSPDVQFASRIKQVKIDLSWSIDSYRWQHRGQDQWLQTENRDWSAYAPSEKDMLFWQAVVHAFPSARKIALVEIGEHRVIDVLPHTLQSASGFGAPYNRLIKCAPPHLLLFTSFHHTQSSSSKLLRIDRSSSMEHTPVLLRDLPVEYIGSTVDIIPPRQQIPKEPLRSIETIVHLKRLIAQEEGGIGWAAAETQLRFKENKENGEYVKCPNLQCQYQPENAVLSSRGIGPLGGDCTQAPQQKGVDSPQKVHAAIHARVVRLGGLRDELRERRIALWERAGKAHTNHRGEFIAAFSRQAQKYLRPRGLACIEKLWSSVIIECNYAAEVGLFPSYAWSNVPEWDNPDLRYFNEDNCYCCHTHARSYGSWRWSPPDSPPSWMQNVSTVYTTSESGESTTGSESGSGGSRSPG